MIGALRVKPPLASTTVCSKAGGSAVVYSLFVVAPIVCGGLVLCLCFVLLYFM